ncbi:hypothetical protein OCU04_008809 [Sclerotinia nivalis]|uniref:Uncharacterized protein n=1 Tax=Sclerotinia nivalis TaxID=352851 RepID=A0A9X0AGB6_9HELO|nr:hypothetical protein OCU04_008809 [Sclerotinia nivalis]
MTRLFRRRRLSRIFIEDYKQAVRIACFYIFLGRKLTLVGGLGNEHCRKNCPSNVYHLKKIVFPCSGNLSLWISSLLTSREMSQRGSMMVKLLRFHCILLPLEVNLVSNLSHPNASYFYVRSHFSRPLPRYQP